MATNKSNSKAFELLGLVCLTILVQKSFAIDFKVGGLKGWCVPSDPNAAEHNQWAERNRFQIGDSLLFDYHAGQDSVLLVNKDDYANCKTDSPIQKYSDGHTVFKFNQSGSYYFISGNKDNCKKNEKLVVTVLSNRSKHYYSHQTNSTSPPPSASTETPPSPAPATGTAGINPTPAPISEPPPPPNGASAITMGFMGVFAASSLVLAF